MIVSHLIILQQTDLGSTYSNFKFNVLSIWKPFITLILPRILIFSHSDLEKPQTSDHALYSWKQSKCGWPGFRRGKGHLSIFPKKRETSYAQARSTIKQRASFQEDSLICQGQWHHSLPLEYSSNVGAIWELHICFDQLYLLGTAL